MVCAMEHTDASHDEDRLCEVCAALPAVRFVNGLRDVNVQVLLEGGTRWPSSGLVTVLGAAVCAGCAAGVLDE